MVVKSSQVVYFTESQSA